MLTIFCDGFVGLFFCVRGLTWDEGGCTIHARHEWIEYRLRFRMNGQAGSYLCETIDRCAKVALQVREMLSALFLFMTSVRPIYFPGPFYFVLFDAG